MTCAGSLFLDCEESQGGDAARNGTAAGDYLERLLTNKPIGAMASNGVYFDEDMKFYTTPIRADIESRTASEVMCEHRIDWLTPSGVVVKGSPDIAFVDHEGTLCIEDLKYGFGIVEVKENWQLLGYAIGEVIRRNRSFDKISLKIHQPRPHHEDGATREWILTYPALLGYKERIENRMQEIVNGLRTLVTSEHCKYCPAAGEACTAFNRLFYSSLEVSTEFVQDSLTEQEISTQLDQVKRALEVIKIKQDSLVELGVSRIKRNLVIPGYTQVPQYTNRVWNNGITPDSLMTMTGLDLMEKSFMSPAKAEKAGVSKELVNQLAGKRLTRMKLEKKDTTEIGNKIFGTKNPLG